jgi:hypothetical protein
VSVRDRETGGFFLSSLSELATLAVTFKSREDHRKQLELEEARKAGLAPAEVDEDGNEINPHIPQYMSSAPWYLNADKPVGDCFLLLFVAMNEDFAGRRSDSPCWFYEFRV